MTVVHAVMARSSVPMKNCTVVASANAMPIHRVERRLATKRSNRRAITIGGYTKTVSMR